MGLTNHITAPHKPQLLGQTATCKQGRPDQTTVTAVFDPSQRFASVQQSSDRSIGSELNNLVQVLYRV